MIGIESRNVSSIDFVHFSQVLWTSSEKKRMSSGHRENEGDLRRR